MSCYFLEVRERLGQPKLIPMQRFPFWIGRDPNSDLALPDRTVSRRHAWIETEGDRVTVVDNHSRNGVLVNHQQVTDRREVGPEDVISIGRYELRVTLAVRPTASPDLDSAKSVAFLPPAPSWDPIRRLSSGLASDTGPPRAPSTVPWDHLLRLLVSGTAENLYQRIMEIVEDLVSLDRCFLILFRNQSLDALEIVARRIHAPTAAAATEVCISRDVLRRVAASGEAVVVNAGDESFQPSDSLILSGARSLICIPLTTRGQVLGALYIDRLGGAEPFSEQVVSELAAISGLVALKIDNVRLLQQQVEIQINRRELEVAKSVQDRFLPTGRVHLPGYSFDTFSQPCQHVGGDCIDFVRGTRNKLTFTVGDVAGKGLPAALYMVGVMSTLRAHIADGFGVKEVMAKLEGYVRAKFAPDLFLTLFLAELDLEPGQLAYCNAGHVLPIVFSAGGEVLELEARDPALNIMPWHQFTLSTYALEPGDLLLVYTDGLTDVEDARGQMFGKQRLISSVQENLAEDVKTIRRGILDQLKRFGAEGSRRDDVALILLRREAGARCSVAQNDSQRLGAPLADAEVVLTRRIESRLELRHDVIRQVFDTLAQWGFQPDLHFHRLCLDEALINAITHGNGGDSSKYVTVRLFCSPASWAVEVTDEGPGFDWEGWLRRLREGLDVARASGRGLDLIVRSGAEVQFLDEGRTVRMIWKDAKEEGTGGVGPTQK